jgi:hypothetical protein
MHPRTLLAIFLLATVWISPAFADAVTPAVGSPERRAICDAVRAHVLAKMAMKQPPMRVVFRIGHLRVDGAWAWFEAIPIQENGTFLPDGYLPDIDYIMVLQRGKSGWQVVENQSRGDVPSRGEMRQMMQRLPGMPLTIMPKVFRDALGR